MKKDFVMPIVVLALICLVISGALAVTNSFTAPVIAQAAEDRAEAARREVIPQATGFELLQVEGLPETITQIYRSENDVGYVFMMAAKGYGGELKLLCGIGPDDRIIKCMVLEQSETKGLGSRIAEQPFIGQFSGKTKEMDEIHAISGATISSEAFTNAVRDVFTAYEIVRGVK